MSTLHEELARAEAENSPSTAAAIRAAIARGEDKPATPLPETDTSTEEQQ